MHRLDTIQAFPIVTKHVALCILSPSFFAATHFSINLHYFMWPPRIYLKYVIYSSNSIKVKFILQN